MLLKAICWILSECIVCIEEFALMKRFRCARKMSECKENVKKVCGFHYVNLNISTCVEYVEIGKKIFILSFGSSRMKLWNWRTRKMLTCKNRVDVTKFENVRQKLPTWKRMCNLCRRWHNYIIHCMIYIRSYAMYGIFKSAGKKADQNRVRNSIFVRQNIIHIRVVVFFTLNQKKTYVWIYCRGNSWRWCVRYDFFWQRILHGKCVGWAAKREKWHSNDLSVHFRRKNRCQTMYAYNFYSNLWSNKHLHKKQTIAIKLFKMLAMDQRKIITSYMRKNCEAALRY